MWLAQSAMPPPGLCVLHPERGGQEHGRLARLLVPVRPSLCRVGIFCSSEVRQQFKCHSWHQPWATGSGAPRLLAWNLLFSNIALEGQQLGLSVGQPALDWFRCVHLAGICVLLSKLMIQAVSGEAIFSSLAGLLVPVRPACLEFGWITGVWTLYSGPSSPICAQWRQPAHS